MTPLHHPSEATLVVHAAGGLGEGMAFVVAGHLEYCEPCRSIIAAAEAVGGVLLDEIVPEEISAETRFRVVSRLDREWLVEPARPSPTDLSVRSPLGDFLAGSETGGRWEWLSPGVRHLVVSSELRLMKAAPGRSLPIHAHAGSELALVLEGAYSDALGRYGPGDVAELDEELTQWPVADRDNGCLFLLASDGPLKPVGWLGRALQRWPGFASSRSS